MILKGKNKTFSKHKVYIIMLYVLNKKYIDEIKLQLSEKTA